MLGPELPPVRDGAREAGVLWRLNLTSVNPTRKEGSEGVHHGHGAEAHFAFLQWLHRDKFYEFANWGEVHEIVGFKHLRLLTKHSPPPPPQVRGRKLR